MATYFHGGSEIQADGLQTLYLMNPGYVGYSDTQQQPNMVFLNSAGNTMNLSQPPQQQNHQQHFVGIPLQATPISPSSSQQNPNRQSVHSQQHEMSAIQGFIPRVQYNLWTQIDQSSHQHQQQQQQQNSPTISSLGVNNSISVGDVSSQLGLRRSVVTPSQQGLSLSLSSQQPGYGPYRTDSDIQASAAAPVISPTSGEDMRVSGGSSSSASGMSNGTSNMQSVLLGSKYLKAAQQLLDEVVNVGKGIKTELSKGTKEQINISKELSSTATGDGSTGGESIAKQGADLTTTEKQELQMKKAKLVSMLDEVEQRYRQYHHQMQIVVSSFEQAAGFGSAKTYTALALQTISKQFRCLKDAISGQIRATSKSLGEDDCLGSGKGEGSRLRFVDHQLRQQRALQQLGMIQHNAWRPQRGLPERSVSILRAWLFEHFLHPYPKDSDKLMLAKQTGLTRSQVSNWFINARVRLWKPMVEEMYMEETKDHEQNGMEEKSKNESKEESGSKSNTHQENSPTRTDQTRNFNSNQDSSTEPNAPPTSMSNSTIQTSTMEENMRAQAGFFLNFEGMTQGSNKKSRNTDMQNSPTSFQSIEMDMKPNETDSHRDLCRFGNERQNRDGYSLIASTPGGFGAYSMGEMGRFDPDQFAPRFAGNGVSLTLGLPHCENLSLSGAQQNYLSNQNIQLGRGLEMSGAEQTDFCGISTQQASPTTYENINMQNRKRFAAQLLPDFVA